MTNFLVQFVILAYVFYKCLKREVVPKSWLGIEQNDENKNRKESEDD